MKFSELVRLLEENGFRIIKEKGSIRYYGKPDWSNLIRVDYRGSKEVPKGTCRAILMNSQVEKQAKFDGSVKSPQARRANPEE